MVTIKSEGKEIVFSTNEKVIEFIKLNPFLTGTVSNEKEVFSFVGGKIIFADTPWFIKIGKTCFAKGQ